MELLTSQEVFLEKLKQHTENDEKAVRDFEEHNLFESDKEKVEGGILIQEQTFIKVVFNGMIFDTISFKNCRFENCYFTDIRAYSLLFKNCRFENCRIHNFEFFEGFLEHCEFENCNGGSFNCLNSHLFNTSFINCNFSSFYFSNNFCIHVMFGKSVISNTIFEYNFLSGEPSELCFTNSFISDCFYRSENLNGSVFENCQLNRNSFINCLLSKNTFPDNNKCEGDQYSSIDLHTVVNSEAMNYLILKEIFGVNDPGIKSYIKASTEIPDYQSVFISYSFKDSKLATRLNKELKKKGIRSFMWEEDAPGGRRNKDIMYKGIREKDRVIFICSKDSLKSEACHYELSEAQRKENEFWKDVLFPITVDRSIFDTEFILNIHKYGKKNADEWIANINWLKEYHILDFSKFTVHNEEEFDEVLFETEVNKLIQALRKRE